MTTIEEQTLTRAFDRLSAARAKLSAIRASMSTVDHAELWWLVSQARLAVSGAQEALAERCTCDHSRAVHWTTGPPHPRVACRDCDECPVYEAREG